MNDERARRARVRAQLLCGSRLRRDPADVVSAIVGVQAQDETVAALSIRARTSGLVAADLWEAVSDARSVVLTWSLRGTRHLHHADDVRWLVGLLGPLFGRPGRRAQQLGISGRLGVNAVRVVRQALAANGPLTRRQIKDRLVPLGIDPSGQASIHVIRRAALEGVLCIVPNAGSEERYVLMDDWIPARARVDPESAIAELARRYLAAHGPATPADLAAWSGLGTAASTRGWAAIAGDLMEVELPGGAQWLLRSRRRAVTDGARRPAPVRLPGGFDALLLGYRDRSLHVPPERARDVNAGGGLIKPVVLSDGRVIGTWRHRRDGAALRIEVASFRRLTPGERAAVDREARDIGRFLGMTPTLTIGSADKNS
ncbi:MAG: winged helix DNA-binding domain-containing protein [Actinomycetota bacterium]|nr:winged helix DNA-binding domain-containing protein [Actinomycetota bacterium]